MALAIKALGGGLWEYDIDADRIRCNHRWYAILGLNEKIAPISTLDDFRPHIHPEDVQHATEVDLEKVDHWLAYDEIYHVDFRIIRPNNEIRFVRSVACLIRNSATGHREAVGCLTDITDYRPFESVVATDAGATHLPLIEARQSLPSTGARVTVPLTQRETECLMWVSLGKTATETGLILGKSRRTVEFHLNNAVRKLNAANKIHATAIAIRRGII